MADFKRLGYFVQIAELGSLTRAAERLRVAQPSLSRQMRLLEEELGVPLFTRGPRGMKLTEAGETLRARISGPLRQIGHALYEIRSSPGETVGSVTFGMPPTFVATLGPKLAASVAREAPKISLRIVEGYSGHLLEWMKREQLDAALLYGPTPSGLNATRILEDELVLVGQRSYWAEEPVPIQQLAELPLVLPSQTHGLRLAVESAAARTGVRLNVQFEADSFQLMVELVKSGSHVTILPPAAARDVLGQRQLSSAQVMPPIKRQVYMAMLSRAESPKAIVEVTAIARREVARMVEQGLFRVGAEAETPDL